MSTCPRCGKETDQPFHTCIAMSTTPRTDEAWEQYNKDGNMHALAHKHKQLETELIALQKENILLSDRNAWQEVAMKVSKERDQLLTTVEGLRNALYAMKLYFPRTGDAPRLCVQKGMCSAGFRHDQIHKQADDALQSSIPPTNLVKRSVLEKCVYAMKAGTDGPDTFAIWNLALKEAQEELERTK